MPSPMDEVVRAIREGDGFLVSSHFSPDGDALGATAAMGHIFEALGKRYWLYNPSGLPHQYEWMQWPARLNDELPCEDYPWCVILDCGDLGRVGPDLTRLSRGKRVINIDHHLGNPNFGEFNWVDINFSSTGEMLGELARGLGLDLAGALGECVYLSLVSDTGFFSYSNTKPETLELAAGLMRHGLAPDEVNEKIKNQWTLGRLHLWSEVLGSTRLYFDGKVGVIRITQDVLGRTGTGPEDCDGLINFVLRVRGVRVALSVRETKSGEVKFSLRSVGRFNVQEIAASFGGGGHRNAAGGIVSGGLDEVENLLKEALRGRLD